MEGMCTLKGSGGQRQPGSCAQCGKRQMDDGVKLLNCSRCGSQWYCGKVCQVAAWQAGHKKECYSMAAKALDQAVNAMGGRVAATETVWSWAMEGDEGPIPREQQEAVKLLLPLSRTVAEKAELFPIPLYASCVLLNGLMALHRAKATALQEDKDVAGCKRAAATLEEVDNKFGHVFFWCSPDMTLSMHLTALGLLSAAGTFKEAVALARRALPKMEQIVERGDSRLSRRAARYMIEMSFMIRAYAAEVEGVAIKSVRVTEEEGGGWESTAAQLSYQAGLCRESVVVAKRSLAVAEGSGLKGSDLCMFLALLAEALRAGRCFVEALTYSRRLYEVAPHDSLAAAARDHGKVLAHLGRTSEAVKVYQHGLQFLKYQHPEWLRKHDESYMHTYLAEALLKLGRVEEALEHVMHAREIHPPPPKSCGSAHFVYNIYAVGAEALERLGRLDEAREWDIVGVELTGTLNCCADRRLCEGLLVDGRVEDAMELMRETLRRVMLGREAVAATDLPDENENRRLDLYAAMLETSSDPEDLELAANLRADVEESRAILAALREAVLVQTREEAAMAAQKAREEKAAWLSTSRKSTGGKKGKQRGKGKKKGAKGARAKPTEGGTRPSQLRIENGGHQEKPDRVNTEEMEDDVERRTEGEAHVSVPLDGEKGEEEEEEQQQEQEQEQKEEECAICFVDLEGDGEEAEFVLLCGHRFHAACVDLWVNNCRGKGLQVTCPMCRAELQH